IRGIRAVSDFEYEFQIALMNRKLCPEVATIFLMPNEKYTYLNSTIIRELARYGANVSDFVPPCVSKKLKEKFTL
ncbi:MAG: pantetheine-phosphate adenylyltransferase, partial [Candidatus Kapaibacteriota bacterium]